MSNILAPFIQSFNIKEQAKIISKNISRKTYLILRCE